MDPEAVRAAMERIGCKFWPQLQISNALSTPDDLSELCTLMLHFSHNLTKLYPVNHSKCWYAWFNPALPPSCPETDCTQLTQDPATMEMSKCLIALFDRADHHVKTAHNKLIANGFPQPTLDHLKMTALKSAKDEKVVELLLAAASSIYHSNFVENETSKVESSCNRLANLASQALTEKEERLGFWGYHDSGFALQVDKDGSYFVSMRGNRYSLSGKSLTNLLPFVERETGIKLNPFNEAFDSSTKISFDSSAETPFGKEDVILLQSTVAKMSLSAVDRLRHGTGHAQEDIYAIRSNSARGLRVPDAVLWPECEKEVETLIGLSKDKHWCIIPFGGGTNVTQATRCPPKSVEPRPILSVDMTKMNRLIWLNEEDGLACFEAGINGIDLVATLERRGYTMGHEPDSFEFSTLGGWIATKASGMKRTKYGNIEDIVRDVRVTGTSGAIWQRGGGSSEAEKAILGRESCGLDLKSLLIGSEGCLGIITSAVVKIWKLPEDKDYESILFSSFEHGLSFVRETAKLDKLIPASVRLLDNEHFRLGQSLQAETNTLSERLRNAIRFCRVAKGVSRDTVACATICFEGNESEVAFQKAEVQRLATDHGGTLLGPSIGKAGYDMTFMIAYLRDFAMTYHFLGESFETFAPWSKVSNIVNQTKAKIRQEHEARCLPGNPFVGCRVTQLYHDGACLYFYICINTENVKDASRVFHEIEQIARTEILLQGGSLSHHHGIGKVRADLLQEATSEDFKKIVCSVKESIDPHNIFAARNGLFCSS